MKLKRVRSVPLHNYGLPYKGSKNKIARWVVSYLPAGGTLYDLFCGGCAVTHAAIEAKKFKHFVINDITPGLSQFFVDCIHGKYSNRTEFVSHEEFDAKKDKDLFIRLIWSFGNNLHTYLYNRDIEEFKRIVHYMLTGKTVTERRLHYRNMIEYFRTYGEERGGWLT